MSFGTQARLGNKGFESYSGGRSYFIFTAAMGTTPQLVKYGATRLAGITNPGATAFAVTLSLYDSNTTTSPATNGTLVQTITTLQPGTTLIDIPMFNGIVIVASAPITGTVLIQYV